MDRIEYDMNMVLNINIYTLLCLSFLKRYEIDNRMNMLGGRQGRRNRDCLKIMRD